MATVTTPTAPIGAGLAPSRSRRVTATALYGVRVPTISRRARPCGRARGLLSVRAASSLPDDQRVVITGAGVVSTAGNDRESFFDSLLRGESGVIDLTAWRPGVFDDLPTRIGAPILDLAPGADLTPKEVRRMDKVHQYAVCAGKRALRDAGLWGDDWTPSTRPSAGCCSAPRWGGCRCTRITSWP